MKHLKVLISFFIFTNNIITAQNDNYKINKLIVNYLPDNVDILGLGDPTHQESTITKHRIDLIKKLVEQKKIRVIAVEGNIYGLYKAHKKFIENGNITSFENSMYSQLNMTEMEDLYKYVYDKNKGRRFYNYCWFWCKIFWEIIRRRYKRGY